MGVFPNGRGEAGREGMAPQTERYGLSPSRSKSFTPDAKMIKGLPWLHRRAP